jgi:hypothetical protein
MRTRNKQASADWILAKGAKDFKGAKTVKEKGRHQVLLFRPWRA